jgi:TFIIF-interacting CTD phosphatase-like protein
VDDMNTSRLYSSISPREINTIILDLDETLIHTFSPEVLVDLNILTDPLLNDLRDRSYILRFYNHRKGKEELYAGIMRPHLFEFLDYVLNNFIVIVHTAGDKDYAHAIVNQIFLRRKPDYIFSNEDCLHEGDDFSKPIKRLFERRPVLSQRTRIDKIIAIDDRQSNFIYNPKNGILIKAYEPQLTTPGLRKMDNELV